MDKVYVVQQKLPAKPRIWKKPWGPVFLFFGHDVQSVSEQDELTGASVKPAKASSCLFSCDLSRIAFRDRLATLSSNVRTDCVQDVAVDPFRVGPKRFPPQYLEEVVAGLLSFEVLLFPCNCSRVIITHQSAFPVV